MINNIGDSDTVRYHLNQTNAQWSLKWIFDKKMSWRFMWWIYTKETSDLIRDLHDFP